MKKLICVVIILCLMPLTAFAEFADVKEDAYYYDGVMWAVEQGITKGTGENTFSPDSACTRAQVLSFIHRMVASPPPALIDNPFADVKENDYFYNAVLWAVGSEITGGTGEYTFSPNESCTRAQALTFLWRTAGQQKPQKDTNPFVDVKNTDYFYDAVLWAVENGITDGTGASNFSPNESCTRAQVVTILYRFING